MKKEEFSSLIQLPFLLDGATGSNLMAAGMPRGVCTETWVRDQKAYVDAGSQAVYSPTFGAYRISLSMHCL